MAQHKKGNDYEFPELKLSDLYNKKKSKKHFEFYLLRFFISCFALCLYALSRRSLISHILRCGNGMPQ